MAKIRKQRTRESIEEYLAYLKDAVSNGGLKRDTKISFKGEIAALEWVLGKD